MILEKEIYVIDDFIDAEYQKDIRNVLIGQFQYKEKDFPWYYIEDITVAYDDDSKHRPGLSHQYVNLPKEWAEDNDEPLKPNLLGRVHSEYHDLFVPMLQKVGYKLGLNSVRVLQGRSFLQFPLNTDGTIDTAHIDIEEDIDFMVALYYVCDSDGDTVIYNEREELPNEKYTIKESVTPKQGRMVIFDGRLYHAAKQPINSNTRCVVNYNLGI